MTGPGPRFVRSSLSKRQPYLLTFCMALILLLEATASRLQPWLNSLSRSFILQMAALRLLNLLVKLTGQLRSVQ